MIIAMMFDMFTSELYEKFCEVSEKDDKLILCGVKNSSVPLELMNYLLNKKSKGSLEFQTFPVDNMSEELILFLMGYFTGFYKGTICFYTTTEIKESIPVFSDCFNHIIITDSIKETISYMKRKNYKSEKKTLRRKPVKEMIKETKEAEIKLNETESQEECNISIPEMKPDQNNLDMEISEKKLPTNTVDPIHDLLESIQVGLSEHQDIVKAALAETEEPIGFEAKMQWYAIKKDNSGKLSKELKVLLAPFYKKILETKK